MPICREQSFVDTIIATYGGQTISVRTILDSRIGDRGLILSVLGISVRDYADETTYLDQLIRIPTA